MQELLAEVTGELVPLVLRAVAAIAFTVVGTVVELNALGALASGNLAVGFWALYMGGLALYAGLAVFGADLLDRIGDRKNVPA